MGGESVKLLLLVLPYQVVPFVRSFVDMEWRFGENLHSIRISGRPIPSARLNEERSEADGGGSSETAGDK